MHVYVHTNETVDTPFTSSNSGLKTGTELNRTVGQNRAGISYPLSLFAILLLLLPPKKMNPPPVQIQFMEPETSGPTPGRFPAYDSAFCAPVGAAVPLVRRRRRRADKLLKHPTVTGTRKKKAALRGKRSLGGKTSYRTRTCMRLTEAGAPPERRSVRWLEHKRQPGMQRQYPWFQHLIWDIHTWLFGFLTSVTFVNEKQGSYMPDILTTLGNFWSSSSYIHVGVYSIQAVMNIRRKQEWMKYVHIQAS